MAMQVPALAPVIRNAMTGVKFKAAGNKHDELCKIAATIISLAG